MNILAVVTLIEALARLAPLAEGLFEGKGRGEEKAAFVTESLVTAVEVADEANIIGKKEAAEIKASMSLVPRLLSSLVSIFHNVGTFSRD